MKFKCLACASSVVAIAAIASIAAPRAQAQTFRLTPPSLINPQDWVPGGILGGISGGEALYQHTAQQVQEVMTMLKTPREETLTQLLEGIWQGASGPLGLPDLNDVRTILATDKSIVLDDGSVFDPMYDGREIARASERSATRAWSDGVLGQRGQQATLQKIQRTAETLSRSQQALEAALNSSSTQGTIKALALQQTTTTELLADLQLEQLKSRTELQLTAINLANVSEQLEQQQYLATQERYSDASEAARMSMIELF